MNTENIESKITDTKEKIVLNYLNRLENPFALLSAKNISKDLNIGINQAYDLLKQEDFPTVNIGKKKVVTIAAYLLWKMNKKGAE